MKITVTQDHIKNGCTASPGSCPIALAIRQHGYGFVSVSPKTAALAPSEDIAYTEYNLPKVAQDFICNFDLLGDVEPFTFELANEVFWC